MNSNPAGEPIFTGPTDQFTAAAVQATQIPAEQAGGYTGPRRRTDEATDPSADRPGDDVPVLAPVLAPGDVDSTVDVVLHAERLLISRARYATERVRFSKRIVTTTRTFEVPVRIEQLVISHEPFPPATSVDTLSATSAATPAATSTNTVVSDLTLAAPVHLPGDGESESDLIIVLHEEVPEFTLRVASVERVTIGVRTVVAEQTITATLGSETISVDQQVDQMHVEQTVVGPATH